MGASLGTLLQKQNFSLGTSETNLYTREKRIDAINLAITQVLDDYDIPQYTISTTLNFTAGTATLPTDCLRPFKISDNNNVPYDQVDFETFARNIPQTYSVQWSTTADAEVVKSSPALTQSLTFWYIQIPTALEEDSDTYRFKSWWDNAIVEKSVATLLLNSRNTDIAQQKEVKANELLAKAWQNERKRLVGREDQRLQSVYEKKSLLGVSGNLIYAYTVQTMGLTWLTVTASQDMLSGYGYNTNSASLIELLLPSNGVMGDIVQIVGMGAGGWRITQNSNNQMIMGNLSTTAGTGGYIESTYYTDSITLECLGNGTWTRIAVAGNISVI